MNKAAIRRTALAIITGELALRKKNPIGFNLGPFYADNGQYRDRTGNNCGTVACVAGWAHFIHGGKSTKAGFINRRATKLLGLNEETASKLFAPDFIRSDITPTQAALTLYILADTGKVNWDHARHL